MEEGEIVRYHENWISRKMKRAYRNYPLISYFLCIFLLQPATKCAASPWDRLPTIHMNGGLRVFWNIHGGDDANAETEAVRHGFETVDIIAAQADLDRRGQDAIAIARLHPDNPWMLPAYLQDVALRNMNRVGKGAVLVEDMELPLEDDVTRLWNNSDLKIRSGAKSASEFRDAYLKAWAKWYSIPLNVAKKSFPKKPVGIYGVDPFPRQFVGLETQKYWAPYAPRRQFWLDFFRMLDPYVDFCPVSLYIWDSSPNNLYYFGARVEENVLALHEIGEKPVYPYVWLRYHDKPGQPFREELTPSLAEGAAIIPFFFGARGIVLWGWEPHGKGPYYERLPDFFSGLSRVAQISGALALATPTTTTTARELWWSRRPLVRQMNVSSTECLVLAVNPGQSATATSATECACGSHVYQLTMHGQDTEIYWIRNGKADRI